MNKAHKQLLKENYEKACEEILMAFCKEYELSYDNDAWTAGDVGTVAMVGDYFIDLQDMIYMLCNDISWNEYLKWYDYNLECGEFNFNLINLKSWHMGAPRVPQESFDRLHKMKKDLEDAIKNEKEKF